jgi:DNA-directed RNA polymerase omega subunit
MIYHNLERIYETTRIENKYALAMLIVTRARQLSERKGRALEGQSSELFITYAIEEIEDGILDIASASRPAPKPGQMVVRKNKNKPVHDAAGRASSGPADSGRTPAGAAAPSIEDASRAMFKTVAELDGGDSEKTDATALGEE